jgi:hypothetical protein
MHLWADRSVEAARISVGRSVATGLVVGCGAPCHCGRLTFDVGINREAP